MNFSFGADIGSATIFCLVILGVVLGLWLLIGIFRGESDPNNSGDV